MGRGQRDWYRTRVDSALDDLARFPKIGWTLGPNFPDFRGSPVAEHVIYYKQDEQSVTVLRILHRRMSAELHLPSEE
jgi:plasmid stabilization system protein ParE